MFHIFFSSLARSTYLSLFSLSFNSFLLLLSFVFTSSVFHISVSWSYFTVVWVTSPQDYSQYSGRSVVWMLSTSPLTSKSSNPFINTFCDCTKSTNYNWYNCHFHVPDFFLKFLIKVKLIILHFTSFQFYSVVTWDSKVHNFTSSLFFFLLIITKSGQLADIRWSVCMSKSQRSLYMLFSRTNAGLCMYHLFVWSDINLFDNSPWITLPRQSCLVLMDWWFRLYHHITNTCCFLTSYLFLLWYDWSLWRCFVLLLEKIHFLSYGFPFLAISMGGFCVICRFLVG